jgi:predicted membrane protein
VRIFSIFSPFLIHKPGKENLEKITGIICVVFLILFFSAVVYGESGAIGVVSRETDSGQNLFFLMAEFCIVFFGIVGFLAAIIYSYNRSHCRICNRDLAYEKIGESRNDAGMERGMIMESKTITYKCRFCGNIRYTTSKYEKYPERI